MNSEEHTPLQKDLIALFSGQHDLIIKQDEKEVSEGETPFLLNVSNVLRSICSTIKELIEFKAQVEEKMMSHTDKRPRSE